MQSLVNDAEQGGGGLPRWEQVNRNSGGMVGDGPVILLATAHAFGADHFDTTAALAAMETNAGKIGATSDGNGVRAGLDEYLGLGYVLRSVSITLEYASADFALSQFARALGDSAKAELYLAHSGNWANLYNPSTGCLQRRNRDGSWVANVGPDTRQGYTEGNAAQYTWMVPFDLRGLFDRMGGNAAAVERLDRFFTKLNEGSATPYAFMGNEPGEGTPWEYDYAGAPAKTQDVVRRIQAQLYTNAPNGLPGNDDAGALSSWYVFSALGLYPNVPGVAGFVIGSPLFSRATLHFGADRALVILGVNASVENRYVQTLEIDGVPTANLWLPYAALGREATLRFTLGARPLDVGSGPVRRPALLWQILRKSLIATGNRSHRKALDLNRRFFDNAQRCAEKKPPGWSGPIARFPGVVLPMIKPFERPEQAPNAEHLRWFSEEVHAHDSAIKAYLRSAFPSVGDVDDVVQESYLRIWKIRAAEPIRSAKALLFTVARRLALDLVRRDRRSPFVPVKDISQLFVYDSEPDASEVASSAQEIHLLVEAIDSLPARCREIFILCQVEDLTQKEVALRLGLSENTVGVQSARGLQRCEEFLRRHLSRP